MPPEGAGDEWLDTLDDCDKRLTPVLVRGNTAHHWDVGNVLFICDLWASTYLRFSSAAEFCKAFCLQSVPSKLHVPTDNELRH